MTLKQFVARAVLVLTLLAVLAGVVAFFVATWPEGAIIVGVVAALVALVGGIDWAFENA